MADVYSMLNGAKSYGRDLLERVVFTFLEGFLGGVVITQPLDASMWYAAAAGGVAAVGALVKGLAARAVGSKDSASLSKRV